VKALTWHGSEDVRRERSRPTLERLDILLRMTATAICVCTFTAGKSRA